MRYARSCEISLYDLPVRAYKPSTMREFMYGLILGAASIWCYHHFDAPGVLAYLNDATASAARSTGGYGGKAKQDQNQR